MKAGRHFIKDLSRQRQRHVNQTGLRLVKVVPIHHSGCTSIKPSPKFYSSLFMASPHPISICTLAEKICVDVNDAWANATGYQRHEVLGRTINEIDIGVRIENQELPMREYPSGSFVIQDNEEGFWITVSKSRVILWTSSVHTDNSNSITYVIYTGLDITRQQEMENRLQERDAELRSIFANANGIIFTANAEGTILFISPGWTELLGHDVSEVEGKTLEDFLHAEDIPYCKDILRRLVTTEEPVKFEYRIQHRDGSWHWHSCTGGVAKDAAGEVLFYVGIAADVTDRKHMEQALQKSEEKLAKAFYVNPDAIAISTVKDGCFVDANEAFMKSSGWERDEVIGRTSFDLNLWVNSQDREHVFKLLKEQGYFQSEELKFRMKSGEIRTFIYSGVIIDVGGEAHLLAIIKDIHELKQADEALRLSEDKFSKAFNASPTPLSISTLERGLFIDVNDSFCRVVGYRKDELVGHSVFDLRMWADTVNRFDYKERLLRGKEIRDLETYFRRKSGEVRLGLYSAEIIDIEGEACLLSILTDITDQKQAQAEIRYLSFHDKLTGLYNRAYFEEELTRLDTERQLPISLIMGDVNGLKLINDALGHLEGDKLLIAVASVLKESCRSEDVVARWGGDEFIILLPGCDSHTAAHIMERIKNAETLFHSFPIQTSISLGMATKSSSTEDVRGIIKEAEDKMYRNKLLENRSTRSYFLSSLERTLWSRSHETKEHCERMQKMALQIGRHVNLPSSELDSLKLLAVLHDIGKIAIPNSILEKPGKLTPEEWETIKKHPEVGYRIALSSPEMSPIAEAILHHHERWDGGGYPLGLRAKDIPFLSRIISIVDAYDVMINGRPYQRPVNSEEAWSEISRCAGSHFDPDLVKRISVLKFE